MNNFIYVIVCHDSVFGPPHELRDYLLGKNVNRLLFIGHQNRYVKDNPVKSSYYELYENGKLVHKHSTNQIRLPEPIAYVRDFILTFWWTLRFDKNVHYFIGLGNLNAFVGILLNKLGRVSDVYYYVIDYIPHRFKNPFMNSFYHQLDRQCALYASSTWNYAPAMIKARNEHWNTKFPMQQVVPNGIHIRSELIQPFDKINRYEIIYVGTLYEQQGIQLIIKALPAIIRRFPLVRLTVIGQGPYRTSLEELARKIKVLKYIKFLGYIADPLKMEKRLSKAAVGLGMYKPESGFVAYTEPGKIKRYLAVGVPVIMTNVSQIAKDLVKFQCGIIAEYNSKDFTGKVISFLSDEKNMKEFRKNAILYAKNYEWQSIFDRAFQTSER